MTAPTLFNWIDTVASNLPIPWPKPHAALLEAFCQAYPEVRTHIQVSPATPIDPADVTLPLLYGLAFDLWLLEQGIVPLRCAVANAVTSAAMHHRHGASRRVVICDADDWRAMHPPLTLVPSITTEKEPPA